MKCFLKIICTEQPWRKYVQRFQYFLKEYQSYYHLKILLLMILICFEDIWLITRLELLSCVLLISLNLWRASDSNSSIMEQKRTESIMDKKCLQKFPSETQMEQSQQGFLLEREMIWLMLRMLIGSLLRSLSLLYSIKSIIMDIYHLW